MKLDSSVSVSQLPACLVHIHQAKQMDNVGTKSFSLAICLPKYNYISLIFSSEADIMQSMVWVLHQMVLLNVYIRVEKLSVHYHAAAIWIMTH